MDGEAGIKYQHHIDKGESYIYDIGQHAI